MLPLKACKLIMKLWKYKASSKKEQTNTSKRTENYHLIGDKIPNSLSPNSEFVKNWIVAEKLELMASFGSIKQSIFNKQARKQYGELSFFFFLIYVYLREFRIRSHDLWTNRQYQDHIRGLNAFDRHKKFLDDYGQLFTLVSRICALRNMRSYIILGRQKIMFFGANVRFISC